MPSRRTKPLMQRKPDEVTAHATWGIVAAISGKNLERGERELKYWLSNPPPTANAVSYSNVHMRLGQIYEKDRPDRLAPARSIRRRFAAIPRTSDAKNALSALK